MPRLVNWELLSNPINWIIVALMVATAAFGLALLAAGPAAIGGASSPNQ